MPTRRVPDLDGSGDDASAAARSTASRNLAGVLGALTGAVTLVAMARLAAGAFPGGMSGFGWAVVLAAMLPWVVYATYRARHGRLAGSRLAAVAGLVLVGAAAVWLPVPGPVLALVCSFVAFVLVWVADLPVRRASGPDRYVRIEELQREDELD